VEFFTRTVITAPDGQFDFEHCARKMFVHFFNCCLSVHVDNYTIIVPTKCISLLKAQDITICTFLSLYSYPLHVSAHVGHLQGAQCQCLAKVINDYNSLKLR
jgi:hypothetical protein